MISFHAGEWLGLDSLDDDVWAELRPRAGHVMMEAALMAVATVKKTLTGRRSGRTYKVSKLGKLHVASAPGEPPARLFSHLINSIGYTDPEWDGAELSCDYGPGLGVGETGEAETYSRRLEWGGVDSRGVRILPRPYMEPSQKELDPLLSRLFEASL